MSDLLAQLDADLAAAAVSDELPSLDELLAESVADVLEKKAVEAARARLKRPDTSAAQREHDRQMVERWERENVWEATTTIRNWTLHECQCGYHSRTWEGDYTFSRHRTQKDATRLERTTAPDSSLPIQHTVVRVNAPACPACTPAITLTPWTFGGLHE